MKGDIQRIRDTHGVPAKRGGRVIFSGYGAATGGTKGTITGTWANQIKGRDTLWLRVRLDGETFPTSCHPTECIEYLPDGAE